MDDVTLLSAAETRALEPELGPGVRASFRVPREAVIDPWSAPHAYLLQALANGASLQRDCEVLDGAFDGDSWRLDTFQGAVRARWIVNAAGLYGDLLDRRLNGRSDFTIRPRKGQFVVYGKPAAALASHILLPVPGKITKGVVVCRTAYGNPLVGPTAEEQEDRATAALAPETLKALKNRGEAILPALAGHDMTAIHAGLRPATEFKDYRIRLHGERRYVSVGGIRLTGLSVALGVARHVWAPLERTRLGGPAVRRGRRARLATLRQWRRRLPLRAPRSLAGLKRRTRVAMGRCQGFYCLAALAAIAKDRLPRPIAGRLHER